MNYYGSRLERQFVRIFKSAPDYAIDTGGRYEICGNHTDHNHGLCLVANASLRIKAYLKKNETKVRIKSAGYSYFEFDVSDIEFDKNELNKTLLLAKGVLFRLKELGYKIGGFDATIESKIPDGSGVSSSAAIESLFGYIISYLYNDGKIPQIDIAKTGKFSENVYFGKPSGLLDQVGTSFDSFNYIDFKDVENPIIQTLPFNLPLKLFLIKSAGDHANLTPLYAEIPSAMKRCAKLLDNKEVLRECESDDVISRIDKLEIKEDDKKKARHFFNENNHVLLAKEAIETNDVEKFLSAIRLSQDSSKNNLKNTFVEGEYEDSPQNIIDVVTEYLGNKGAARIHGGGFKGTAIIFVKNEHAKDFRKFISEKYSKERIFEVTISSKAVNFKKL